MLVQSCFTHEETLIDEYWERDSINSYAFTRRTYLIISSILVSEPSARSETRQTFTSPSLEPDAKICGWVGQKCTDHIMRLCADSLTADNSNEGTLSALLERMSSLFQMHILRSFPDEA